jgi:hypothetical protein
MPWKMENQHLLSPLQQRSCTLVSFGQWFLNKEQCDNTGASPIPSWPGSSWFLPIPLTEISIEGIMLLWFYWQHSEHDRGAAKAFTEWLAVMFPTTWQSLAVVYICTRGLFWRKCTLNVVLFCISRNKVIPGTFWSYHVYQTCGSYAEWWCNIYLTIC